jgi:DnaK suppressor protein
VQPAKLQSYRERLLDERRALVRQRERVLESIPEQVHPPGESEIVPSDGLDIDISLDRGDVARIRDIDAALQLIKEGTFGTCAECGREISEARLEAIPSALYCVRCEEQRDRG